VRLESHAKAHAGFAPKSGISIASIVDETKNIVKAG